VEPVRRPILSPYLGLEQEAAAVTACSMYHVPALLQTDEYARRHHQGHRVETRPRRPHQRVEARLRRQRPFARRTPLRYEALLDEAVLRRQVDGAHVIAEQLGRIVELAAREKAASRPSRSCRHPCEHQQQLRPAGARHEFTPAACGVRGRPVQQQIPGTSRGARPLQRSN
jgi:Domain of unknown function (DUF5753)